MDEIWDLEERFWLAGIDHFQAGMHLDCIMAFPAPVGILTVVVAYHARATRDGSPDYSAYCTSTYVRAQDGWRLVQHQQTAA